jgi:hypothetical protein
LSVISSCIYAIFTLKIRGLSLMATDNINSSNQSTTGTGDLGSVLERSPWGRLSEVTSTENVIQGFGSATGGTTGSAPSGAGGGNPFTNFGNPNASGSPLTGGTNPWAAIGTGGSSAPSGGGSTSDFGGIDFGSASQSPSFQNRVEIEGIVNSSLYEAGVPLSGAGSFDGGASSFGGGAGGFGGSTGGFDVSSIGGFGGGNQFGGGDIPFAGGGNQFGGGGIPFAGGGNQFGGGGIPFA